MLLSMLFDDDDETSVSALFQVGDQVVQLKQKPHEGRVYNKEKEDLQEYAMAHPDESYHPSSANGDYESAFPNVGLVVWQSGFVLGEYLLRTQPLGPWKQGQQVLELGCGTGQLGIVLALAGAAVTMTDLEHIVPLTQANVDLNAARCSIRPVCCAYMWGTPVESILQAGQQQQQLAAAADQQQEQAADSHEGKGPQDQQQQQADAGKLEQVQQRRQQQQQHQQQQHQQQHWDAIVAADVLYEPHHYDELLNSLMQLCPPSATQAATNQPSADLTLEQQQQHEGPSDGLSSPPVYICYRVRRYGEHGFESKATQCGFKVTPVPIEELHKDYQCGGYRLICLHRE